MQSHSQRATPVAAGDSCTNRAPRLRGPLCQRAAFYRPPPAARSLSGAGRARRGPCTRALQTKLPRLSATQTPPPPMPDTTEQSSPYTHRWPAAARKGSYQPQRGSWAGSAPQRRRQWPALPSYTLMLCRHPSSPTPPAKLGSRGSTRARSVARPQPPRPPCRARAWYAHMHTQSAPPHITSLPPARKSTAPKASGRTPPTPGPPCSHPATAAAPMHRPSYVWPVMYNAHLYAHRVMRTHAPAAPDAGTCGCMTTWMFDFPDPTFNRACLPPGMQTTRTSSLHSGLNRHLGAGGGRPRNPHPAREILWSREILWEWNQGDGTTQVEASAAS